MIWCLRLALAARLIVATTSPVWAQSAVLARAVVAEDRVRNAVTPASPWKPGGETATLPWSAPVGHHQPRVDDVPARASSSDALDDEDARVDRAIRGICRGC